MRNLFAFEIGDAEVREIQFSVDAVALGFFLPSPENFTKVWFREVEYFAIESNFMQNVVESAILIERNEVEENIFSSDIILHYTNTTHGKIKRDSKIKYVYISPIAGAEIFIVCKSYEIVRPSFKLQKF